MRRTSYVMVDNRAAGGGLVEYDVVGCRHCQAQLKIERGAASGAYCMNCAGPVCNTERCATRCSPFYAKVEAALRRFDFARAAGLAER